MTHTFVDIKTFRGLQLTYLAPEIEIQLQIIMSIFLSVLFILIFIYIIKKFFLKVEGPTPMRIRYVTPGVTKISIYVSNDNSYSYYIYNKIVMLMNSPPLSKIPIKIEINEVQVRRTYRCNICKCDYVMYKVVCPYCGRKLEVVDNDKYDSLIPRIKNEKGEFIEAGIDAVPSVFIEQQEFYTGGRFNVYEFTNTLLILENIKDEKRLSIKNERSLLYRTADFIKMPQNISFPRPYLFSLYSKLDVNFERNTVEVTRDGIQYTPVLESVLRELGFLVIEPDDLGIYIKDYKEMEKVEKLKKANIIFDLGDVSSLEEASRRYLESHENTKNL